MRDEPGAPKTGDRNTFQAELDALRVREKAHTREGDAPAARAWKATPMPPAHVYVPHADEARRARGNVLRLATAQALAGANASVIFATGAIIGATLAPSPAYATV